MQEIHRGLISFHSVLTNISALQVNYLCDPLRRAGIPCDHSVIKNQICSSPTQVPDVNFLCELLEQIDDLIHMYGSLEYQHQRMVGYYLCPGPIKFAQYITQSICLFCKFVSLQHDSQTNAQMVMKSMSFD